MSLHCHPSLLLCKIITGRYKGNAGLYNNGLCAFFLFFLSSFFLRHARAVGPVTRGPEYHAVSACSLPPGLSYTSPIDLCSS